MRVSISLSVDRETASAIDKIAKEHNSKPGQAIDYLVRLGMEAHEASHLAHPAR